MAITTRTSLPAVQLLLTLDEANELAHALNMYRQYLIAGEGGSGSAIVERIKFLGLLSQAIDNARKG